jgi:hypothetical protein
VDTRDDAALELLNFVVPIRRRSPYPASTFVSATYRIRLTRRLHPARPSLTLIYPLHSRFLRAVEPIFSADATLGSYAHDASRCSLSPLRPVDTLCMTCASSSTCSQPATIVSRLCFRAGLSLHSVTIHATRRLMLLGCYLSSRMRHVFSPQVSGKPFLVV